MTRMAENVLKTDAAKAHHWQGRPLAPLMEVDMFFKDQGPVPETFRRLRRLLEAEGIPYIVIGAMAVNAHGFRRTTRDIDICMSRDDLERFRKTFVGRAFEPVPGRSRRFVDPETQVTVDILISGEIAGRRGKNRDVRFPHPSEGEVREAVCTVSLARLIELKLVTWRYQDWGDVVNLIRHFNLDEAFAENLHTTVRAAYKQCYDQRIEEDKYNPELDT
jgi:hypothetical protein